MKIRPTLYVGLGTTGVEIINKLRILNREEYGTTEYPIFRYISIETDTSKDGIVKELDAHDMVYYSDHDMPQVIDRGPLPEFKKNKVLYTTIPSVEPISNAISPKHPAYNKDLDAWLNPEILDLDAVTQPGGAGNIRMVGRLSLWENWDKGTNVQKHLQEAYDAIWEHENRQTSAHNLEGHFKGTGITVDDTARNVFIVGTLCGGTCGGMLLDIAYYFRHIGFGNTNIYGIFTMYDEALALQAPHIQMANCHASLVELDYYSQDKTEYNVTFPNGPTINTKKAPFEVATFVSATNMKGERVIKPDGEFDEDKLNEKVALDLFVRHLGVDAEIDANRVNAPTADDRFGKVRHGTGCIQYMFSSGLETKGYPKNHTTKAAATEFIKGLHSEWNGISAEKNDSHGGLYGDILADIRNRLTFGNKEISSRYDKIDNETSAKNCLTDFFYTEGYNDLKERVPSCIIDAEKHLEGCSLDELRQLSERIPNEMESYPAELDDPGIDAHVTVAVKAAEQRERGGLWGIRSKTVINPKKLQQEMGPPRRSLADRLTKFFVRRALDDLLSKIQKRIENDESRKVSIQEQFDKAIDHFPTPPELQNEAKSLSQELLKRLTPAGVKKEVDCLKELTTGGFHLRISHHFRRIFEEWIEGEKMEFSDDDLKMSAPSQSFTDVYGGNFRLKLTSKGGGARLFRYLLAKSPPEANSETLLEFEGIHKELPIGHLRALYQMEAGFTLEDLRVSSRLKEEYDKSVLNGVCIHVDKDIDRFSLDAIRGKEAANTRTKEVEKHWRALRELLPIIGVGTTGFEHISLRNGASPNGRVFNPRDLRATVSGDGETGINSTFLDDDSHTDLVNSTVAYENFIRMNREAFKKTPRLTDIINTHNAQIEDLDERRESEAFYQEYRGSLG